MKDYLVWVNQSRLGNRTAFGHLVERFQGIVYSYLFRHLHEYNLTQDLMQEVFIRAFRGIPQLKNPESFVSWLYKISHQVLADYFRKRVETVPLEKAEYLESIPYEKSLEKLELLSKLEVSLSELPEKYQTILSLKYFEQKSYEEISEILGLSFSTIDGRMTQAKVLLRKKMGFYYGM
ncbi:MAG: RNA polymerase sigma factor [Planctomycetota bacterium]